MLGNVLRAIADEFSPAVLASSLSAEDMVLTDAIARHQLPIGIFVLDTGRLHGDTLVLLDRIRSRYGVDVAVYAPDAHAVAEYVRAYGRDAFYQGAELRKLCCAIRKVEPLARWSEEQGWQYIRDNRVPYNRLYEQGYRSIGCAPCTRPVRPDEDPRAGRWWWELAEAKECGLHVSPDGNLVRARVPA